MHLATQPPVGRTRVLDPPKQKAAIRNSESGISNPPSSIACQNPVRERQVRAADVDRVIDAGQAVDFQGGDAEMHFAVGKI